LSLPLFVDGQGLVYPEICPRLAGERVACPLVGNLVNHSVDLGLVASDYRGTGVGKEGVFHSSEGEGRRKHQEFELAPDERGHLRFELVKIRLESTELLGYLLQVTRF